MLKVLRDNLKYLSWILWGVILVFIFFVFAEWGGAGRRLQGGQQVALSVDGDAITFPELDRAHRNLQQTYRSMYGGQIPSELEQQLQLPVQAVQQLVRQRLLVQEAEAAGIRVSDKELAEQMLELPIFKDESGNYIGDENYTRAVRSLGYPNPASFEEAFRQDLMVEKLNRMMRDTLSIPDEEVEKAYRDAEESARIDYVLLPAERFAAEIEASDEQLQAFFAAHSDDFRLPERRVVRYLFVDPATIRAGLSIDDPEVEVFFQQNGDDYRREERVRIRQVLLRTDDGRRTVDEARSLMGEIRARLDSGGDFASVASEHSEDPASRDQGGDLGFIARGEILPEVENAAFATTVGEVVGPIETSLGLHLVEVTDKQPGGLPAFDEVKEQVRSRMLDERAVQVAAEKAQQLASSAGDSDSWAETAANDSAVSFFESEPIARNQPLPGLGMSPQFSAAAFALEVGETSPAVQVGQAWAVLSLTRIEEPRVPELDEVRDAVQARFVRDSAMEVAKNRLADARADVEANASLQSLADELELEVVGSDAFTRESGIQALGPSAELVHAVLAAKLGQVVGPIETPRGAVLAVVTERTEFDPTAFALAREATEQQLRDEQASRLIESLLQRRQEMVEIEYSPDLTAQLQSLS